MNSADDNFIEAEVVNAPAEAPADDNQTNVLLNLEQMIKNNISIIDKTRIELKKHKEMLEDILLNNPTYQEHLKKAKEATQVKSMTRGQIMKQPNVALINEKIKEMQAQIKELDIALSDYLREYERMSGSNEIEGDDGEVREIVYTAKLVRKSSLKK